MNRVVSFAGLMFLTFLAAGSPPEVHPGPRGTASDRIDRAAFPAMRNPGVPAEGTPFASEPPDEERRNAASTSLLEFSGGPTGTLLIIGAALAAALGLILVVVVPW